MKELFNQNNNSLENQKAKKVKTTVLMEFLQTVTSVIAQFGVFFIGAYLCIKEKTLTPAEQAVKEILRLLLTIISSDLGVAAKLSASSDDLGKMARSSKADVPAMTGWRFDIFGQKAMAFKDGKLALAFDKKTKRIVFENR